MAPTDRALDAARRDRDRIVARIAAHPLSSPEFVRAREVARSHQGRDEADAALREEGLPTTGAQTRMLVLGLTSLARLNRRRIRLEERIARLERPSAR